MEKITLKIKKKKGRRETIAKISFSRCPRNLQPQVIAEMRDLPKKAG